MIFVDTNVLSLLFRRNQVPDYARPLLHRLKWLVATDRVVIPGLVVQELLSGIRHQEQFDRIHGLLQSLPLIHTSPAQHVAAARIANLCASKGVATHVTDALLASLALEAHGWVLTEDPDFLHMAACCGVHVLSVDDALRATNQT